MIEYKPKHKIAKPEVHLRTLTPLWTGGINKTTDRVHETSIIGSLRWWYEAIVRGLGHDACDPVSGKEKSCSTCHVCQLFGCTGSKRRFSVNIKSKRNICGNSILNIRPYGRSRGWFLPQGFTGDITLQLYGEKEKVDQIISLFHWLSHCGNIGAKSQLGYGIFEVQEPPFAEPLCLHLLNEDPGENPSGGLPDLRTFTFFKFQFAPRDENWWKTIRDFQFLAKDAKKLRILEELAKEDMVPVSPLLKDYFRFKKEWNSLKITKWLFGTIERNRKQRSRVNFSWAYKVEDLWEVRGWAWLPYWGESRYWYREAVNGLKNIVEDKTEWLKAMDLQGKVSKAKVYIEPKESSWGMKTTDTVMKWLKGGVT